MTFCTFNHLEAVFWWAIAITIFIRSRNIDDNSKKIAFIAGKVFFLFGLTDLAEAESGAWWTPWWLLIVKGSCVLTLLFLFFKYREIQTGKETGRR